MNEKVLRASAKWKIIIIICTAVFFIPCGFGEYWTISEVIKQGFTKNTVPVFIVLQLVMIPFIILGLVGLLQVFGSYVKVRDNEFEYFSGFSKHITISANQIKSWYITQQITLNYHITYSADDGKTKTLKVEMIFLHNEVFGKWLKEHAKIIAPEPLSANEDIEGEIKSNKVDVKYNDINKYIKISKFYNYIGIALAVIPLILIFVLDGVKNVIRASYLISLIWFFLGLILVKVSKEIVRIDEQQGQKYPSIMRGMFIGPFLNILLSVSSINLMINLKIYLFVSIFILFIMFIIFRLFNLKQLQFIKESKKMKKASVISFYFLLAMVVFGNVPGINQMFSFKKNYESYVVTVVDKKGDEDIIVTPWINSDKTKSIEVSKSMFLKIEKGDEMKILVQKGCLGIPFYTYKKL